MKAWLTEQEAAWVLGLAPREISVLVAHNLLEPLKIREHRSAKYFWPADLERLRDDPIWWDKAREAILEFWSNAGE